MTFPMFMWRTKSNWHRNQCSAHHLQLRVDNAPRISQEKRRPYKGLDRSEIMEETCAGGFLQWSRRTKQNHPRLRPLSHWSGASLGRFRSGEYTSPKAPLPIEINGQRRLASNFNPCSIASVGLKAPRLRAKSAAKIAALYRRRPGAVSVKVP